MFRYALAAALLASPAFAQLQNSFAVVGSSSAGVTGSTAVQLDQVTVNGASNADQDLECRNFCRNELANSGTACTRYTLEFASGSCTLFSAGSVFATEPATTGATFSLGGVASAAENTTPCTDNNNVSGTRYSDGNGGFTDIPTGGCVAALGANNAALGGSNAPQRRVKRALARRARMLARAERERALREQ